MAYHTCISHAYPTHAYPACVLSTQVAAEPRLSGVFHELASAEGVEVYIKPPHLLGLSYGHKLSWEQVRADARASSWGHSWVLQGGPGLVAAHAVEQCATARRAGSALCAQQPRWTPQRRERFFRRLQML
jgi:hypothetical protein